MPDKKYSHDRVPGEPIVVVTLKEGYNVMVDAPESSQAGITVLNSLDEQVFWILDMRALQLDLDLLIQGAAQTALNPNSIYRHPNIREVLFVFDRITDVVEMAAEGLNSERFGYIKARVFASVEEALAYARANT